MMKNKPDHPTKLTLSTCSLAGCFGCHMSFLDVDERLLDLVECVEFIRSPLVDQKQVLPCDIGLVEGGLCNQENIETLQAFRAQCNVLVAVGACALNGGIPALRNHLSLQSCLEEVYLTGVTDPQIPSDEALPLLLDKVYPVMDAVQIDYVLPGCPPPAEAFLELFSAIIEKRQPDLAYKLRRFD